MRTRVIVVPVIRNATGDVLLCRMPEDRGVFPGQWGLPGGGLEDGETVTQALHREVREELGISVSEAVPLSFRDDTRMKRYPDGSEEQLYLVYLLFSCQADTEDLHLNDEFDTYAFVPPEQLNTYDLNPATQVTFSELGLLAS